MEIGGGPGRQPAARPLVTSMIVSFTLRTSTRPSTGVSFSRRPVTSIDVEIDGRAGRQPVALVTSTAELGVSFSGGPLVTNIDGGRADRQLQPAAGDEHRRGNQRAGRSSAGGPGIDVGIGGGPGRQPVALVTNTGVSFTRRPSTRPSRSSAGGAALVTSTGVSFRPRTSTRPRTLDRAEHDRQLQPAAGDEHRRGNRRRPSRSSAGGPVVTSMIVSFRPPGPSTRPSRASASAAAPGDEHRRGNRRRPRSSAAARPW